MSIYLLRKQARRVGLLLRAVPGGGWCLLDAARGAVTAGPLDLEHIAVQLQEKENAAQGVSSTPGGQVEQQSKLFHLHHNECRGGCQE